MKATGYVTVAEKDVDWEELKTQLPPRTPKPPDIQLKAGSMVFTPPARAVPLNDIRGWWSWVLVVGGPSRDLTDHRSAIYL